MIEKEDNEISETESYVEDIEEDDAEIDNDSKVEAEDPECEDEESENAEDVDYSRPAWRAGKRDEVWENAKDEHGRVRDPMTGRYMSKDQPWDMGHEPGYEFRKYQEYAREKKMTREEFIDGYNNVEHVRPELPSSNRSHKCEDMTDDYFGEEDEQDE